MSAPFTELDAPLNDYALLCRGCLADSGEMKNMFEWSLAEDFCKFTDIPVNNTEGISELLCTACEDSLMMCRRFREQCQNSNVLLKNTVKKKPPAIITDRHTDDRKTQINTVKCIKYDNKITILITAPNPDDKIYLPCPYNCIETFLKKSFLYTHLTKVHKETEMLTIDLQYYCTVDGCAHALNSEKNKWFSGRKFLNQHYNKVHTNKRYCDVCTLSYTSEADFFKHLKTCNMKYSCPVCDASYNKSEKLSVHLMRKHPDIYEQYKIQTKTNKRKLKIEMESKKIKIQDENVEHVCDSPKRSFATQTLNDNIKSDMALANWQMLPGRSEGYEAKTDEISTQTVFEDLLSLKSQTSEDESIFFSETVSLSDIQTQTFPLDFLNRSHKETVTSETQSPDLSIKETQTCYCHDSPKPFRLFDSVSSSPSSHNLTSTETQTAERSIVKSDVLLSFNCAETQTSFDEELSKHNL
ncbi:uncharacterized protein ACR2FA_010870 [Aphomia sociella]